MKNITTVKDAQGCFVDIVELDDPCPNCEYPHALAFYDPDTTCTLVALCPCGCIWREGIFKGEKGKQVVYEGLESFTERWWIR